MDALVAQRNQKARNSRGGQQVQKGGVVYAQDIDREVANMAFNEKHGDTSIHARCQRSEEAI